MKRVMQSIKFNLMYLSKPHWDTDITAPEIIRFCKGRHPGNAIDLGCGTGTNLLYLAQQGWIVTGLDFAPLAIHKARKKIKDFRSTLLVGDVTKLSQYDLPGPYDFGLDMGCFHNLSEEGHKNYVDGLGMLMKPGGVYMVYAFQPSLNMKRGIEKIQMITLFHDSFEMINYEQGQGQPSAWYYFRKRE